MGLDFGLGLNFMIQYNQSTLLCVIESSKY